MKRSRIISLMLAFVLLLGLAIPTLAATKTTKQMTAEYSGIQITLDGQKVDPKDANGVSVEPFIVDGTTYLPVRALANALGLNVDWDQATQTVVLSTPEKEQPTPPAPTPAPTPDPTPDVVPTPPAVPEKVTVYDDKYVTIEFINCVDKSATDWLVKAGVDEYHSEAYFYLTNKTDKPLTFILDSMSINGISYEFKLSKEIAAHSSGKATFHCYDGGITADATTKTSGSFTVFYYRPEDDSLYIYPKWNNTFAD